MIDDALNGLNDTLKNRADDRPKAVKLGRKLWDKLNSDGRLKRKNVTIKEQQKVWDGIELPFLDDDIYAELDEQLDDCEYTLLP